jgi:2-aminoethylphosphonate-pyruvate transaminase
MTTPILLTPGPLTTSSQTKQAMLTDWGSWDQSFNQLTASVCQDLTRIVNGQDTHVCIPLQGSGTFAVEAALGTLIPRDGKVLVPNNGAYCQRIVRILGYLGRQAVVMDHREDEPANPERIAAALAADKTITHVALVHCETGTGILNPLHEIAQCVAGQGRCLIVDAMSSYAALPIDLTCSPIDALIAASGKCLEGAPGMGFVIARQEKIEAAAGNSHSLALDLHDQWVYMRKTGQWRFTPPTHVVAALRAALDQFHAEGGTVSRGARYQHNCNTLVKGMRALGLHTFLADELQAPIIVTFHAPAHPDFDFTRLYRGVRDKGFILYPGKLTQIETFRVGCIGAIGAHEISLAVDAIAQTLHELGVYSPSSFPLRS